MENSEVQRRTYTIEEARKILGIGRSLAYRMAETGELPAIKLGGRYLVPADRLEAWLAGRA